MSDRAFREGLDRHLTTEPGDGPPLNRTVLRIVRPADMRGDYRGRSAETIARRLFGRTAQVWYSPDDNNPYDMIVRTDRHGTHVLAEFIEHT